MIDFEQIDGLFEWAMATGASPPGFHLLDKAFLLPMDQLADAVLSETGEQVNDLELRRHADDGLYPLVHNADGGYDGVPLYVPSRIGLICQLRRDGYSLDELKVLARWEEEMVDLIWTTDDLAYVEDDLELLIRHTEATLDAVQGGRATHPGGTAIERSADVAAQSELLDHLRELEGRELDQGTERKLRKMAYRVRAFDDVIRVMMLDQERAKILAGFSPWLHFRHEGWSASEGFSAAGIMWPGSLRSTMALWEEENSPPTCRVPGLVLRGSAVTSTETTIPSAYKQRWDEYDVDRYLREWAELNGERRCLHCHQELPGTVRANQRFCGERCRNADKQRRHRRRNPASVERSRKRYWDSIEIDSDA